MLISWFVGEASAWVGARGARCGPAEPAESTPRAAASRGIEGGPFERPFLRSWLRQSPPARRRSCRVFAAADGETCPSNFVTIGPAHAALGFRVKKLPLSCRSLDLSVAGEPIPTPHLLYSSRLAPFTPLPATQPDLTAFARALCVRRVDSRHRERQRSQ